MRLPGQALRSSFGMIRPWNRSAWVLVRKTTPRDAEAYAIWKNWWFPHPEGVGPRVFLHPDVKE